MGPDQRWPVKLALNSANAASCRRDNNVIPGPFDTVNSKSPVFEKRTNASPISVALAVRYISCPVLVCHPAAGSANWCCETETQLVRHTTLITKRPVATAQWAAGREIMTQSHRFDVAQAHRPASLARA